MSFIWIDDDRKSLCFPFHVTAGSATFFHGLIDAIVAFTTERSENILRSFLSAELAVIIFEVHAHEYRSSD
jgi:hypothetical protein